MVPLIGDPGLLHDAKREFNYYSGKSEFKKVANKVLWSSLSVGTLLTNC